MQYHQQAIALGSKTDLTLVSNAPGDKTHVLYRELWKRIFAFERQFSRFLPGSELSTFNRNAGTKQAITAEFRDILVAARNISHETDGLYNPFILPALQAAGYVNSRVPGFEQDATDDHANKSVATIDKLEISDQWARIPYGTALDLGGCGKGYLADQLRDSLPKIVTGYWLSLGGDMAVGGRNERGRPWEVAIQSAEDSGNNAGMVTADDTCGIATSGTTVHHGKKAGRPWHHIIDPRTRLPATTDVLLATVCDASALRADVLASCAVALGSTKGLDFLKKQGVRAALLQYRDTSSQPHKLHFGNVIMDRVVHA